MPRAPVQVLSKRPGCLEKETKGEKMSLQEIRYVGIDWATEKHDVCVDDVDGRHLWEGVVGARGSGLAGLVSQLKQLHAGNPREMLVAIERPDGPVVATLQAVGYSVYSVPPGRMKNYRALKNPGGEKSDGEDARLLSELLRTHRDCCRFLEPKPEASNRLGVLVKQHVALVAEGVAKANQLKDLLKFYYPQFLTVISDLRASWVRALWLAAPGPEHVGRLTLKRVQAVLRANHGPTGKAQDILTKLRETPVVCFPGTESVYKSYCRFLFSSLELTTAETHRVDHEIDKALADYPDAHAEDSETRPAIEGDESELHAGKPIERLRVVEIIASMPGAGRITQASLLGIAPHAVMLGNEPALRSLCGTAPITVMSGKTRMVRMRRHSDKILRDTIHNWAINAIIRDPYLNDLYRTARSKGHTTASSLRRVGDSLIRTLCSLVRKNCLYETNYKHQQRREAA